MLIASNFMLWIVVALQTIAVLALARQVQLLHARVAPMGALMTDDGPVPGEAAPLIHATTASGRSLAIGPGQMGARSMLILFLAEDCPMCRAIVPLAAELARREGLDILFVGESERPAGYAIDPDLFVPSALIGRGFNIAHLPSAVLIRRDGVIAARGPVRDGNQLEAIATLTAPLPGAGAPARHVGAQVA